MKRIAEFSAEQRHVQPARPFVPVLAASIGVLGIVALHWQTAASVIAIWWRSETFAHGFVVVPICLWLIWRRRDSLARIPARPWWPGLALVFIAGALWLVMSVADIVGVRQFALAFMIQAAVLTILGTRLARALVFPLAFFLFAIPAGEILVPTLIEWTADFTISALRWSGVPVYREGNHFIIPSGRWSVVEACSGIRYVIASFMVGTIYAYIAYRSSLRRAVFMAVSILVPIVANWLRAYMIVMIGHLSNNKYAVGVDHLIYGWIFFGLVMVLLFWLGSFWQEDTASDLRPGQGAASPVVKAGSAPGQMLFVAAFATILASGIWLPIEYGIDRKNSDGMAVIPAISGNRDWVSSAGGFATWRPRYTGFSSEMQQTFRNGGQEVGLYIAYYRNQEKGRELVTSGNLLVERSDWNWKQLATGSADVEWVGKPVAVDRAEIMGNQARLEVFRLYWIDGRTSASEYVAKARLAWAKLSGRGDDSALVVIYTPVLGTGDSAARETLRAFAAAMSPSIERALAAARGSQR